MGAVFIWQMCTNFSEKNIPQDEALHTYLAVHCYRVHRYTSQVTQYSQLPFVIPVTKVLHIHTNILLPYKK